MCIAILNKKDSILTDEVLTNSFLNNPDGAGFAYINKNRQLTINKGIFKLEDFLSKYKEIKKDSISDILIHCRIGTSGLNDATNTHPHIINNSMVLIHNGILNINVPKESTKSDTILFIEKYLKDLQFTDLLNIRYLLGDFIGLNNKFIIMNNLGQTLIINETSGHQDDNGNWFSNSTYNYKYLNDNYDYDSEWDTLVYLPRKQIKKLIQKIRNLGLYEFIELGEEPLVNIKTLELIPSTNNIYNNDEFISLFNLEDITPYEEYINLYNTTDEYYEFAS